MSYIGYISPNSNIYFHQCNLTKDSADTVWWSSNSVQTNYFRNNAKFTRTAQSYQRGANGGRNWIRAEFEPSEFYEAMYCDYLMFENNSFDKNQIYCFITKAEYINNNVIEFTFEVDWLQTYFSQISLEKSFISRYTPPTDAIGENVVPEDVSFGNQYVAQTELGQGTIFFNAEGESTGQNAFRKAVILTKTFEDDEDWTSTRCGVPSGADCLIFIMSDKDSDSDEENAYLNYLGNYLKDMSNNGQADSIISMYLFPYELSSPESPEMSTDSAGNPTYHYKMSEKGYNDEYVSPETGIHGQYMDSNYISYPRYLGWSDSGGGGVCYPKNKKLYTYPYIALYWTNFLNDGMIYHYEDFEYEKDKGVRFRIIGCPVGTPSLLIVPRNHLGKAVDLRYSYQISEIPQIAFNVDTYAVWMAQNSNRVSTAKSNAVRSGVAGALGGALTALTGIATGNINSVASGANATISSIVEAQNTIDTTNATVADMMIQPNQIKGNISGTMEASMETYVPTLFKLTIRGDYAQKIDDYFSQFGYKYAQFGIPSLNCRPHWTYIELTDCHVGGKMPALARQSIENRFNTGLRFWNNIDEIGDYSLDNSVD